MTIYYLIALNDLRRFNGTATKQQFFLIDSAEEDDGGETDDANDAEVTAAAGSEMDDIDC